ncbi:MAG: hypothetical protein AAGC67_03750 [Myxococcota bacterium]
MATRTADEVEVNVRLFLGFFAGRTNPSSRLRRVGPIGAFLSFSLLLLPGVALVLPGVATAQQVLSIAETEDLVRLRHYEGLPDEEAARIGADGCARLIEMLGDPEEAGSHAEILLAIGACGPEGGLEAIAAWADQPRDGEIDRATFRAWQVLPFALAKLSEHDPRAVARLAARLENEDAPTWTFRHHRGDRLKKLRKRAAAEGLAETDLPEAEAVLGRAAARAAEPAMREHLERARERQRERRGRRPEVRREVGWGATR